MTIGERIKETRLKKGITQKELAETLGIATNSLSRYEIGERRPNLEMIDKIAVALGVEPLELLYGSKNNPFANFIALKNNLNVDNQLGGLARAKEILNPDSIVKDILNNLKQDTIQKYDSLNEKGQVKANGYITALSETDEYTSPDNKIGTEDNDNE